jgi:hypothetical protein
MRSSTGPSSAITSGSAGNDCVLADAREPPTHREKNPELFAEGASDGLLVLGTLIVEEAADDDADEASDAACSFCARVVWRAVAGAVAVVDDFIGGESSSDEGRPCGKTVLKSLQIRFQ